MLNALALSNRGADPIPKANHITITKPDDDKAPQYLAFREAFKEAMAIRTCLLKGLVIANEVGGSGMDNVPISVDEGAVNSEITKDGGKFAFAFLDKQPGQTVYLRANKEGYVVVNDVQLEVVIPANPDAKLLTVILCPEDEREKWAAQLYRVIIDRGTEEKYQQKLKALEEKYQADAATFAAEKGRLQQERDQARATAENASEQLAKIEPGQSSELYKQAKRLFLDGKIEEAIKLIDDEKLSQLVTQSKKNIEQDKKNIEDAVEAWLLKAQLLTVQFRFEDAEKAYLQAIDAESDSFVANFAYAGFTKNLNRFEQAKAAYDRCLEWARKNGKDHELAATLNNLGNLDRDQGRMEEAARNMRRRCRPTVSWRRKTPRPIGLT